MKRLVTILLTTGLAATLMAGDEKPKCDSKDCPAAGNKSTTSTGKPSPFAKAEFKVSNIGCEESCNQLSKTIAGLEGVKAQAVCAKAQVATVEYEEGKTCIKTLTAALKKAGYQIDGQQVSLKVKGMTCGGCATGLSKALTGLPGVLKNDVCHESGTAQVLFNPEKVDTKQIVAVITKEGYSVEK